MIPYINPQGFTSNVSGTRVFISISLGVGGIDFSFPQKAELAEKGCFYQYPRFCSTPQIVRFTSRETYDTSSVHSDRVLVTYERA